MPAEGGPQARYSTRIISLGGATTGTGGLNMYASTIGLMGTAGVGIGTTVPNAALHVNGTGTPAILIQSNSGGTSGNTASLLLSNAQYPMGAIKSIENANGYSGTWGADMTFSTYYSSQMYERMRITAVGHVGIGTTNPAYKLDVLGGIRATNGFYSYTTTFSYYGGNADWNTQSIFGDPTAWPWGGNTFLVTIRGPITINGNAVRASFIVFHSRNTATNDDYGQVIILSSTYVSYGISNYALRFTFNSPLAQVVTINIMVLN